MKATVGRRTMAAILACSLAALTHGVATAQRHAPVFRSLFDGLGSPLPPITTALLVSYQWWWLAPAVLAAFALDILRRPSPSPVYFGITVASTLLVAFVLHTWIYEAFFQPLMGILKEIG